MESDTNLARILIAVTETSPLLELWHAVLERRAGNTEVIVLHVTDDRWHRAASLPFTREVSKIGGTVADFTRQRAEELRRDSVARLRASVRQLAADTNLVPAIVEFSDQNRKQLDELTAGSQSVLIASTLITREPIYAEISRLGCRIELIDSQEETDEGR